MKDTFFFEDYKSYKNQQSQLGLVFFTYQIALLGDLGMLVLSSQLFKTYRDYSPNSLLPLRTFSNLIINTRKYTKIVKFCTNLENIRRSLKVYKLPISDRIKKLQNQPYTEKILCFENFFLIQERVETQEEVAEKIKKFMEEKYPSSSPLGKEIDEEILKLKAKVGIVF